MTNKISRSSSIPQRSSSIERLERLRSLRKGMRFRRAWICIIIFLIVFSLLVALILLSEEDAKETAEQASGLEEHSDGALVPLSDAASRGWRVAKRKLVRGGKGVLKAVGLAVATLEERKKALESILQSGDDDHETESVALAPEAGRSSIGSSMKERSSTGSSLKETSSKSSSTGSSSTNSTSTGRSSSSSSGSDEVRWSFAMRARTAATALSSAAASTDPKVIEKIPLAGFRSFRGELAFSDGTCSPSPSQGERERSGVQQRERGLRERQTESSGAVPMSSPWAEDCAAQHGFCSRASCICTLTYTGNTCSMPKRPFAAHLRAAFEGRFVLSATHVRRLKSVRYILPAMPTEAVQPGDHRVLKSEDGTRSFEVPFVRTGKTNRVVWAYLQQGDLAKLQPVLSQALLDLLPGRDPLTNALFRSCAVVANSGINLLFPSGSTIDAHSMVIRIFDGPTKNRKKSAHLMNGGQMSDFRRYVGSKTTFRILDGSSELLGWRETSDEIVLSPVTSKQHFFQHFQLLNKEPDTRSYLLDPDFANYVAELVRATPTPLASAIFFAVQKCSIVDVYGAHWQPGYGVPELYYSKGDAETDSRYSQPHELKLLEALARAGVVTLAHPCAAGCPAESGIKCSACPLGSACACGKHSPLPAALPGHCHLPGNVTCFYKCPPGLRHKCQGGPGESECPAGMDATAGCVTSSNFRPPQDEPRWASAGGMKSFDRTYDMRRRQMHKARRATSQRT